MADTRMVSKTRADIVIAGTAIVDCLIAEQMLDAGLSVLMLETGPHIDREFLLPSGTRR
jgi:choline dehydrogenase-like flavoprotein